jgi:hypothetical protein
MFCALIAIQLYVEMPIQYGLITLNNMKSTLVIKVNRPAHSPFSIRLSENGLAKLFASRAANELPIDAVHNALWRRFSSFKHHARNLRC